MLLLCLAGNVRRIVTFEREQLVPLTLDACSEYLHGVVLRTLERVIGDPETDEHQKRVYYIVLEHTYYLFRSFTAQTSNQYL
jgi:hypothetical protein